MLILAPKHPVMLVFDLDQTKAMRCQAKLKTLRSLRARPTKSKGFGGPPRFSKERVGMRGFMTGFGSISRNSPRQTPASRPIVHGDEKSKMRIAIRQTLDQRSAYGVLCHELAHIYLGHLGSDADHWWPSRSQLEHHTEEIEAEAVAYIGDRSRRPGRRQRTLYMQAICKVKHCRKPSHSILWQKFQTA